MTATLHPIRRVDRATPGPTSSDVNYAARRAMAAIVVMVVVALVALALVALVGALGGTPAAAADIAPAAVVAPVVRIHVAQPGDTLWSIADRYRGEVGQDRFVDALIDVNGATAIQIGQAVRLP